MKKPTLKQKIQDKIVFKLVEIQSLGATLSFEQRNKLAA